jgi:hypothetical protein
MRSDDGRSSKFKICQYAVILITVGKEVKPSIATVCVCALLLHVEHYNMFRPIWAIIR